jgi:hypothetical protein
MCCAEPPAWPDPPWPAELPRSAELPGRVEPPRSAKRLRWAVPPRPESPGQQAEQLGAPLDVRGEPVARGMPVVEGRVLAARAQDRQAAVARDRVEPGLEADRPLTGPQRAVGGHEGVLEGVLGLLVAGEHVPAEGEQAAVIAVEDQLEGTLVPGADTGDEGVVGAPARKAPARSGPPEGPPACGGGE